MVWPPDIRETIVNEDRDNRERALDIWLGLSGQAPLPEGPLVLPILSGSMRPSIALGSKILIAPADYSTCRLGDVVVYLEGDRLIAHRLLWTLGPFHFHKGDANPNGSVGDIAGVYNQDKNVLGMMPHPERASEAILGNDDGLALFQSLRRHLGFA